MPRSGSYRILGRFWCDSKADSTVWMEEGIMVVDDHYGPKEMFLTLGLYFIILGVAKWMKFL